MGFVSSYDEYEERKRLGRRLDVFRLIAIAIFLLLAARLYWIQIINHETYAEMALQNRLRRLPIKAPRGKILDRNGITLPEQIVPSTGALLGKFPQAFSHVGLISSAVNLARTKARTSC